MKSMLLLGSLGALAAGVVMAEPAAAGGSCASGFVNLSATPVPVQCPGGVAFGNVRGNVALNEVFADLDLGSQLNTVGVDQNQSSLRGSCAVRDETTGDGEEGSGPNTCTPDEAGEIFSQLFFNIFE